MKRSLSRPEVLVAPIAALAIIAGSVVPGPARGQDEVPDPTAPDGLTDDVKIDAEQPEKVDLPEIKKTEEQAAPVVTDKVFDALSPEKKEEVATLLNDAARFVQGIRLQEALAKIWEVEQIEPDIFQIYNLRGAAYTKMRDFEKAEAAFAKAVELIPEAFHARFNHTEIAYVTGRYDEAEKAFQALLQDFPETQLATRRLIEYKILICKLKQGDEEAAERILSALDYLDDTPAYYVSHAAFAYHRENKEKAEEWIQSARRIYSPSQVEVFLDALVEAGWIETL